MTGTSIVQVRHDHSLGEVFPMVHDRAWKGLDILIYWDRPLLPARIETSLVERIPALEVQTDSFEIYDQAYEQAASNRSTGLLILGDTNQKLKLQNVMQELVATNESRVLFTGVVLLYESAPNLEGTQAFRNSRFVLDYLDSKTFLESPDLPAAMSKLWELYTRRTTEQIFGGEGLQDLVIQEAIECVGASRLSFEQRLVTLLSSRLNLTWAEEMKAKWSIPLSHLKTSNPQLFRARPVLEDLIQDGGGKAEAIHEIAKSDRSVLDRMLLVVNRLTEAFLTQTLDETLRETYTHVRPGAPGLLKQLKRLEPEIQNITKQCRELAKGKVRVA